MFHKMDSWLQLLRLTKYLESWTENGALEGAPTGHCFVRVKRRSRDLAVNLDITVLGGIRHFES